MLMFSKHQAVLWQRPQNNTSSSVLLLEKMTGWAGFQPTCPARFPNKVNGAPCRWERSRCVGWLPDGIPMLHITPRCRSSIQLSKARIQYFVTCYFQLCYWRITSIAKSSHLLSLCFISPSTEQKLQYLPAFMKSNRWCMIPIMYSIPIKTSEILPLGGEIDE